MSLLSGATNLFNQTFGTHTGNWGTPDLGVTELAQKFLQPGNVSQPQGGSNLLATSQDFQTAMTPQVQPNSGTQFTGGGGGGGGGGTGGQVLRTQSGGGGVNTSGAQSASDAELQAALSALDYAKEGLNAQRGQLGTERTNALSDIESAFSKSQTQAGLSKTDAENSTRTAQGKALSTAQDVQRQNRNVLRALGILSSSAAGDMLNKPINEYGKQSADLNQQLVTRKNYIDSWLQDRMTEHQSAVRDVEQNYTNLIGNIDRDLRFNDRQRTDAVRQAQAALQQRIQEIQQSAQQYQLTAKNFNAQILQQVAQLQTYQNPKANTGAIQQQLLSNMIPTEQNPQQVATQQTEEQRKRLSGLPY